MLPPDLRVPCASCLQPEELTNILEICNVVFTSMFALEMLLKLAAFGLFDYLRNPYNIFDSVIVIIRCSEAAVLGAGGWRRVHRVETVSRILRILPWGSRGWGPALACLLACFRASNSCHQVLSGQCGGGL